MGSKQTRDLLDSLVFIEEKVDGSQISFSVDDDGDLEVRSHHQKLDVSNPPKMFRGAVEHIKSIKEVLRRGWVYRGECLEDRRHNVLAYDRTPKGHVAIFDIQMRDGSYLPYPTKSAEADRLGFEAVALLVTSNDIITMKDVEKALDEESELGGVKVEGVVIKPVEYDVFYGYDLVFGKFVSKRFKEKAAVGKMEGVSEIEKIASSICTEGRWAKALQKVREVGEAEDNTSDIGRIIREVYKDIDEECLDDIIKMLTNWGVKRVKKAAVAGVAEWYKMVLAAKYFTEEA